jgi:hypothetical protein
MKLKDPVKEKVSLEESLSRLNNSLVVAQSEKNNQAVLAIEKLIKSFEKRLNLLKTQIKK